MTDHACHGYPPGECYCSHQSCGAAPLDEETEGHAWENHDDSCECHITICPDCGCTNETVPPLMNTPIDGGLLEQSIRATGSPGLSDGWTIADYYNRTLSEGAAPRAESHIACVHCPRGCSIPCDNGILADAKEHHEHWRYFADHPLPWELSDTSAGFAVEDANHEVLWRFDHYNRADVERFVSSLNDVVSVEEVPYIRGYNRGWGDAETMTSGYHAFHPCSECGCTHGTSEVVAPRAAPPAGTFFTERCSGMVCIHADCKRHSQYGEMYCGEHGGPPEYATDLLGVSA